MEESKREEIALFRYGLILPFLGQEELEWGVKGEIARRLAQQPYNIPRKTLLKRPCSSAAFPKSFMSTTAKCIPRDGSMRFARRSAFAKSLANLTALKARARLSVSWEPCATTFSPSPRLPTCKRCRNSTDSSGPGWKPIIINASTVPQRWRHSHAGAEKELTELFLWQIERTVSKVGLVMVDGIEFEVEAILKLKKVEVRYNPFDLSCVHVYHAGHFVQIAKPAKISRWNTAAKAGQTPPAAPTLTTGIKPLKQLEQQHRAQKQQQAKELVGKTATPDNEALTLPQFIHTVATARDKKPDALHAREVEALQNFFNTYQPLTAECVSIAMAKAILKHGREQHIDVYLEAIKNLQFKWHNQEKSS